MTLAPLLSASPVIQAHAFAAMVAFALGVVQFAAPKGTIPHRTVGWIWVVLMALVAVSSFWIHDIRMIGPFSPIHLLSIFTRHRKAMTTIFIGARIIAGLFTFLPGRIMHAVAFGP